MRGTLADEMAEETTEHVLVEEAPRKKKPLPEKARPFMWKKGQSGNPGGRPRRDIAAELARAVFESDPEGIGKQLLNALRKGNPKMFVALAERAYGKMPNPVQVGGPDGEPLKVNLEVKHIGSPPSNSKPDNE